MRKYLVEWTEVHQVIVEANNKKEAEEIGYMEDLNGISGFMFEPEARLIKGKNSIDELYLMLSEGKL